MARRRSNGEGSIYHRKDGRWEGALYVLTTSGIRKRLRVYGQTQAEVRRKLVETKAQQHRGIAVPDKVWRLDEYLDYWLEKIVRPSRRPTTFDRYESTVRRYLKPQLGHHTLASLSIPTLQSYLNELLTTGCPLRSVQMVREVLSSALTTAMRQELVIRNVARFVVLPGRAEADVEPWSASEVAAFLSAARGHWLHMPFVLLVLYGMRRGEVLGLRWRDIDFDRNELHIRQQVYRAGGATSVGPVKTSAGRRTLPLLSLARDLLEQLRQTRAPKNPDDLVFTALKSTGPVGPQTLTHAFWRVCQQHDLRTIRLHDVRHTTATLLNNLGVPARNAQLILGHADVTTTMQIYQHDNLDARRQALEQLEGLLERSSMADDEEIVSHVGVVGWARGLSLPSIQPSNVFARLFSQQRRRPSDVFFSISSWLGRRDSNPRMLGPEVAGELRPHMPPMLHNRTSHLDEALKACRRTLLIGIAAVSFAVRRTR